MRSLRELEYGFNMLVSNNETKEICKAQLMSTVIIVIEFVIKDEKLKESKKRKENRMKAATIGIVE